MEDNKTSEELQKIKKVAKSISGFFSLMIVLSMIIALSSVFVWIWLTFVLAVKVFFSGVAGFLVFKFLHLVINEAIKEVDKDLKQKTDSSV